MFTYRGVLHVVMPLEAAQLRHGPYVWVRFEPEDAQGAFRFAAQPAERLLAAVEAAVHVENTSARAYVGEAAPTSVLFIINNYVARARRNRQTDTRRSGATRTRGSGLVRLILDAAQERSRPLPKG